MSHALALVALTHLRYMHNEHRFMLELVASSPLVKLPCSPPRTIPAFGRLARKWWLHELIGQRQRRQHFCTLQMVGGLRAVGVGISSKLAEAPQPHFLAPPCKRCWQRLAAQLAAASMRTVLNGSAWLEALLLPTRRLRQVSIKFAWCRCDTVKRGGLKYGMICSVSD